MKAIKWKTTEKKNNDNFGGTPGSGGMAGELVQVSALPKFLSPAKLVPKR